MATETLLENRPWVTYRCPECGHTDMQREGVEVTCWTIREHRRKAHRVMKPEAKSTPRTR